MKSPIAPNPVAPNIICQRCRATLDAEDNYCRRCGTPTANVAGNSGGGVGKPYGAWSAADSSHQPSSVWESPWAVLPMLFLILGPLALPMLWRSRQFSHQWKIILTVLTALWTAYICWHFWIAMQKTVSTLDEIQKQLQ